MKNKIYLSLLVLLWCLLVLYSYQANIRRVAEDLDHTVAGVGRSFFKEIETTRLWNASHGGVYVPITADTQPNPYLEVANRDLITTSGLQLTLINPAYMTRQLTELAAKNNNIQYHITSLKPIRPANAADEWEQRALNLFEQGRLELFEFQPAALAYRFMAPLPVKQACLKCHAKQGYQVGDIRGGISVTIPASSYLASAQAAKNSLAWMHGLALALGIGVLTLYHSLQQRQTKKIEAQNLILAHEIKDRRQAEAALEDSRQRLALHLEHTPLGVIEWDLEFKVRGWNPAAERIFGFTAEEARGRQAIGFLIAEENKKEALAVWQGLLFGGQNGARSSHRNLTRSGRTIYCDWYNTPLTDPQGQVLGVASLVMDITEQEQLQSQLRQAHKMEAIGTIAGGIAHDFNNILAAILGYADMAQDDIPPTNPAHRKIERVIQAGNRAKELIQHILTVSRTSPHHRVALPLQKLVTEILELVRASTPTTITIIPSLQAEGARILADASEMHQVLMNLCTNAAQAMEEQGGVMRLALHPITLGPESSLPPGPYLELTVSDTGHGIAPEILERIYDPFFTTKAVNKGTGLGLAVVHRIIENHGGQIVATSKLKEGTTFTLTLPIIEEAIDQEALAPARLPKGDGRILVVDDEWPVADLTRQRLEALGYRVEIRTSSPEALELFRSQPDEFDLIITDQTMPTITGDQLARLVHEIRGNIPIILCTGYSTKVDAAKVKALGIGAYLMKPVERLDLATTVSALLKRAPAGG